MVSLKTGTGLGSKAFSALAQSLGQLLPAGRLPEISRRSADIVYISLEIRKRGKKPSLGYDGFMASSRDPPSLMKGYRAEIAEAEAASVVRYRKPDLGYRRDSALSLVYRVIGPCVRK